ncbi:MAG: hypothetical protein PWP03_766 [Candidatus Woesearchaeota archaeon]|nr:hypothetical protein [Candidatus Woesearchaeota archaeon]MDN5328128.1 hypothetical protein [Candidatus Woesearchaeota archaeon]
MFCHCGKKAVIETRIGPLCKEHFVEFFESCVFDTFDNFELISNAKNIGVAVSGGKDSTVTLYLTQKYVENKNLNIEIEALCIDEGIKGYREYTINDLKRVCSDLKVPLRIVSFKQEFNYTLDESLKKINTKSCRLCGIFRRYLLNKYSKDYDVILTGHNLDDEAQSFLMNIFNANTDLIARQGPITGVISSSGFTTRAKPLFWCREKEVFVYSLIKGFNLRFVECPYASSSFREVARTFLNELELEDINVKYNLINYLLRILPDLKKAYANGEIKRCKICGEPSSQEICRACYYKKQLA